MAVTPVSFVAVKTVNGGKVGVGVGGIVGTGVGLGDGVGVGLGVGVGSWPEEGASIAATRLLM